VLVLVYFFNVWLFLLTILGLIALIGYHSSAVMWLLLYVFVIKVLIELLFIYPVAVFFSKQKIISWFTFSQPFHILYTIIAGWLGKFGSYKWKERKVQ
jgi:hypothetical protein